MDNHQETHLTVLLWINETVKKATQDYKLLDFNMKSKVTNASVVDGAIRKTQQQEVVWHFCRASWLFWWLFTLAPFSPALVLSQSKRCLRLPTSHFVQRMTVPWVTYFSRCYIIYDRDVSMGRISVIWCLRPGVCVCDAVNCTGSGRLSELCTVSTFVKHTWWSIQWRW